MDATVGSLLVRNRNFYGIERSAAAAWQRRGHAGRPHAYQANNRAD
jgi:hypothetical protein